MKSTLEMVREIADPDKVDPWDEQCGWCVLTQAELERLSSAIRADAIAEEREACAKVADHWRDTDDWPCGDGIGRAIRARGETK